MYVTTRHRRRHAPLRGGFTLVELLVVLAIISLVISITAAAAMRVLSGQKSSNTEVLITTLSRALNQHWMAVVDQAKNEPVPDIVTANLAGGDPRLARVIWIKLRLKQEFPMTFAEVVHPATISGTIYLSGLPAYLKALRNFGLPPDPSDPSGLTPLVTTTTQPQLCEMAACLLMALQLNRRGVNYDADSLPSGSMADMNYTTAAATTVQVKALVDSWQRPLGFFRWPTGNIELNPSGASVGFNDSLDPEGLLCNPTWVTSATGGVLYSTYCHAVSAPSAAGPKSFKLLPVIISAGPTDNMIIAGTSVPNNLSQFWTGLNGLSVNPMNTGAFADPGYLYSYNLLKLGARGDQ
jgi:prepilin-type N-terminal cleavage/methylation domain-containing protein